MKSPPSVQSAMEEAGRRERRTFEPSHKGGLSMTQRESSGQSEMTLRESASRIACEQLCDAIEILIARTADRLAVPAQWKHKRLTFARAYLGIRA